MRPRASTGLPSPLREPHSGAVLGSKDLLPLSLVALKSRLNTVVNVGSANPVPFGRQTVPTLWSHTPAVPGRCPCSGTATWVWQVKYTPKPEWSSGAGGQ